MSQLRALVSLARSMACRDWRQRLAHQLILGRRGTPVPAVIEHMAHMLELANGMSKVRACCATGDPEGIGIAQQESRGTTRCVVRGIFDGDRNDASLLK